MKTKLIAAIMGLAAFAASASVTISDVIVRQQWPWNGKVNIDYVLTDPEDGEHDITVVMSNGTQVVTNEYGSLSGDLFGVKPGARRIVWDPMHNNPTYTEKVLASFSITLSTPDDSSRQYMILDLSGGYDPEAPIPVSFAAKPPASGWNTDEYKTTKMVLRRIPAGSFMMGSPTNELGRAKYGEELHPVTLTKDFYVSLFMCSVKQFVQIYGFSPNSMDGSGVPDGDKTDVSTATYLSYALLRGTNSTEEAIWPNCESPSFFATLNARAARPAGFESWSFDLLTSSQWEYACRAGTSTALYSGVNITNETYDANAWLLGKISGVAPGGGVYTTSGSFQSNNFGLYDMVGTRFDLVRDLMPGARNAQYWTPGVHLTDPSRRHPDNYAKHIGRGGYWNSPAKDVRSAACAGVGAATALSNGNGFRVALVYLGN